MLKIEHVDHSADGCRRGTIRQTPELTWTAEGWDRPIEGEYGSAEEARAAVRAAVPSRGHAETESGLTPYADTSHLRTPPSPDSPDGREARGLTPYPVECIECGAPVVRSDDDGTAIACVACDPPIGSRVHGTDPDGTPWTGTVVGHEARALTREGGRQRIIDLETPLVVVQVRHIQVVRPASELRLA